jgi:hypothetical protein
MMINTIPVPLFTVTRDTPDTGTDFAGYLTNLKDGYPVQAGYRISGWIFHSKFKNLVKSKINKSIRCVEGFLFSPLMHRIFVYTKAKLEF